MRWLLFLPALLMATPAMAWESHPDWPATVPFTSQHGRPNARVHYDSEHKDIFEAGLGMSGAPAAWNDEFNIVVPALEAPTWYSSPTMLLSGEPYTLIPQTPQTVERLRDRSFVPSMFAELPDFSYALWDWASGNELCASNPPSVAGDDCYEFGGWMGSLNSTHFVPQATWNYFHYHELAKGIAAQCKQYHSSLGYGSNMSTGADSYLFKTLYCGADGICPSDATYPGADGHELNGKDDFLEQCEALSLALEAVGHHFLEDSWSAGHMWHRWGGPDVGAFPGLPTGLATAMTSGMIHGTRSVSHMDDRMCEGNTWRYAWGAAAGAPLPPGHPAYNNTAAPYGTYPGVGDLYIAGIGGLQNTQMYECVAQSIKETYAESSQAWGAPGGFSPTWITSSASAMCHDQRATNLAMFQGQYMDTGWIDYRIDSIAVFGLIKAKSGVGAGVLAANLSALYAGVRAASIADPNGIGASTNTGAGALGPFLGVAANEGFPAAPSYRDPPLPWDGVDSAGAPDVKEEALLRAFNRANVDYWCENLEAQDLFDMRNRCQNTTGDIQEAACHTCEEFVQRQVRVGCGPGQYEEDKEPLCHYLEDNPADEQFDYVYIDLPESNTNRDDAANAATEFCREPDPPIGPCVDAYVWGAWETAYCAATFYPYFYCSSCSSCSGIGNGLAVIESAFEEEELWILWSSPDGWFTNFDEASTSILPNVPLWPATCYLEANASVWADVEVCDPYWNCTTASDGDLWSCYGSPF
jgi:hypothetical protein